MHGPRGEQKTIPHQPRQQRPRLSKDHTSQLPSAAMLRWVALAVVLCGVHGQSVPAIVASGATMTFSNTDTVVVVPPNGRGTSVDILSTLAALAQADGSIAAAGASGIARLSQLEDSQVSTMGRWLLRVLHSWPRVHSLASNPSSVDAHMHA
jgi:hypothetical protein